MFTEYGAGPDEINERWTEERLALYMHTRNRRIRRWQEASEQTDSSSGGKHRVSDLELFAAMGLPVQEEGRA